jgi:predicted acylesterase/phospholipase RssA
MFQRLRTLYTKQAPKSKEIKQQAPSNDRYVLVLSGGGTRGFYTLGVLKALEEAGLKEKVDAIYGVSI